MRVHLLLPALIVAVAPAPLLAADGNRLAYLDEFCDPYYVGRDFPRLTTPQWVGEEGVEAVVVLAIDDMRGHERWEAYLRPILERLKQIDGRAPVSIMTNAIDPQHPHLQKWLEEGLSIEVHTADHPCPCLQGGDFAKAKSTYDRCVDQMNDIPGNRPVAFRMPCCDSRNTPSPRFFMEIFNKTTEKGNFLAIDSSVFNITTPRDPALPREAIFRGDEDRFRKYVPFPSFVNVIEDYPYPYVISRLGWQFPCMVPSDWEAQHLHQPNNPLTVEDLKAALDATVIKQGTFNFVFHPHGWIRSDQVIQLIDHAQQKHGRKVKFLTFREALERLGRTMLAGQSLRDAAGGDSGVRLIDLDGDGYLDVVIGNDRLRQTRLWLPAERRWAARDFPVALVAGGRETGVRFGVLHQDGRPSVLFRNGQSEGAWHFEGGKWVEDRRLLMGLELDGKPVPTAAAGLDLGVRLRDLNGDGLCELLVAGARQSAVFAYDASGSGWRKLPFALPPETRIVDAEGRDAGLRFIDLNGDGRDDLVYSDENRWSVHLWRSMEVGWGNQPRGGLRGEPGAIPMIVRNGTNNGAFFAQRHMWVQNEDTDRLPDGVDRRSFDELVALAQREPGQASHDVLEAIDVARTENVPPLSPEASLAAIRTRPGLRVELAAAEPLIADPVAFDWGPDGSLWVVEMRDYPKGLDGQGQPGGRVKRLEDTNGDGRYDRATLFLDGLPFPTGVKAWRKGILVTAAPTIFYAEDTTGDGRADLRQVLYEGFGQGNQQHRVNGLRWGLDNWLYVGNGDSGGTVRSAKTGQSIPINNRDLRIRPDDGALEAVSGHTQFGIERDDWGNWFGGNNSNPMWHYVLEDRYLRRNPLLAPPPVRKHVSVTPGAARVYPVSRTLARFNQPQSANHFTSACSPMIYRDELLGGDYYGNAFVCEPVHNLVHREIVSPAGVTFTSHRADDEQDAEFLASADNWFRPVMARTGPDGALWIADMYRFVIEHPEWIPPETQQQLDLRAGDRLGRIYRILPADRPARRFEPMDDWDTARLIAALESPNGWQRDMAQQMLLWGGGEQPGEGLRQLARSSQRPLGRLHALGTLEGLQLLDIEIVQAALKDEHPGVRRHAVRLLEIFLPRSPEVGDSLLELLEDADLQVQLQLAYTLGQWKDARAARALAELAARHAGDVYLSAAVLSSVSPDNAEVILDTALQLREKADLPDSFLEHLVRVLAAEGKGEGVAGALAAIAAAKGDKPAAWHMDLAAGLLEELQRRGQPPGSLLDEKSLAQLDRLLGAASAVALDAAGDPPARLAAIRLLGRTSGAAPDAKAVVALGSLLAPQNPPEVQAAAVARLAQLEQGAAEQLLTGWQRHTPRLRGQIFDVLLSREESIEALLAAMEAAVVLPAHLDARRRQQLLSHGHQAIRQRAEKLFSAAGSPQRAEVLAQYRDVPRMTGRAELGKPLFTRHCGACHKLEGAGHAVGPDLAALANKSPQALLVAILDPNQAVEERYLDYAVLTDDGRVLTGMLAAESGASITLAQPEGKQQVILRAQIEELRAGGKSFMPEGLEKDLSPQDLADLIAYLTALGPPPKQFPGNDPQPVVAGADGSLELAAARARIYGGSLVFEAQYRNLGYWTREDDRAAWNVEVARPGAYRVVLDYACHNAVAGNRFILQVADQRLTGAVEGTGTWDDYRQVTLGQVRLDAGPAEASFRSDGPIKGALIDLRTLQLVPVE